ncbi:MAG TPA: hypothetical protein VK737_13265 [Opitutales bacterium]|nr:hypothetical protein [Opitutales bacterium]
MKFRTVVFYTTADDRSPVEEWLDDLDDARAEAVAMGIKFFEEYPNPMVPAKFFEKIAGTHLWEIKCHYARSNIGFWPLPKATPSSLPRMALPKKPGKFRVVRWKWRKPGAKNTLIAENNQRGTSYERHRKIYP